MPTNSAASGEPAERRAHPRKKLDQLAYVGFGADTGGVLLDISEEGLRCQIVGAVVEGDRCRLKFALPGLHSAIEADGQVVWANRSRQGGGVRLIGLASDAREELQQWLRETISRPSPAARAGNGSVGAVHAPAAPCEPAKPRPLPNVVRLQAPVASPPEMPQSTGGEAHQNDTKIAGKDIIEIETAPVREHIAPATAIAQANPDTAAPQKPLVMAENSEPPVAVAGPAAAAMNVPAKRTQRAAPAHPSPLAIERHSAQSSAAERRMPLAYPQPAASKTRLTRSVFLGGCVVAGVVALTFWGFDPKVLFPGRVEIIEVAAPAIAPPLPPPMTEPLQPAPSPQPAENTRARIAPPAPDSLRRNTGPSRPEAIRRAPAAIQPSNESNPRRTANRPGLALSAPRPRNISPGTLAADAPQMPVTTLGPPSLLMDTPVLDSRNLDLPPQDAGYRPPQLLTQVEPVYSNYARQARMQGAVRVNAKIGPDGVPRSPTCVAGNAVLCQMAFQAILKWRYQPATSQGRPVEAQVLVSFNFQLR